MDIKQGGRLGVMHWPTQGPWCKSQNWPSRGKLPPNKTTLQSTLTLKSRRPRFTESESRVLPICLIQMGRPSGRDEKQKAQSNLRGTALWLFSDCTAHCMLPYHSPQDQLPFILHGLVNTKSTRGFCCSNLRCYVTGEKDAENREFQIIYSENSV